MVLVVGDAGWARPGLPGRAGRAAAAEMVIVRGECLPLAGTLPLLPIVQVLR